MQRSLYLLVLLAQSANCYWESCQKTGNITLLVGAGSRTYSFNKSELVEVPPGTRCDFEVVAEPLTVIVLYISGRNMGSEKLIVVFDGDESHPVSLQGTDPHYHQLPPVGNKYTVRLNIPEDEEPSKLMLMVEAEKVQQNLNVRRMETEPVELIPSSEIPTYVTVHGSEKYRIGLLMDCHLRETAGRMDPRVMKHLRNVIFFSEEAFLTSGGDMYLHHNGVFLTNATTVTVHNRRQDTVVLVIAFPYEVSSAGTLSTYGFGDWRRGTFRLPPEHANYTTMVIGKRQFYPETRLNSVELNRGERMRVYRGVVDINSPTATSRIYRTVTYRYKSGQLTFPDFVYTFHVKRSAGFNLSVPENDGLDDYYAIDDPKSKEEEEEETEADGASLKPSLLLSVPVLLMSLVF